MLRYVAVICTAVSALIMLTSAQVGAQIASSMESERASILSNIQTSVVRAIGAQAQTVEVTVSGPLLIVSRVNSNMNDSTHAGRDNEATAIASIVSKAVVGNAAFKDIISLQVRYIVRSSSAGDKVIDTVVFREGPNGVFQPHGT
jgi:hypothetical protein